MKLKFVVLLSLIFMLTEANADYVISVVHLKNGNKTVATDIGHYNSMSDCRNALKGILERAGLHIGGAWFISDETESPDLVTKAYFFHEEAGLSCVIIPSDRFGTE